MPEGDDDRAATAAGDEVGDADGSGVPDDLRERIEADPFCATLGIELRALSPGRAVTALELTDDLVNFHGTPHGGAIYSLADAAFAAASNSHGDTAVALETNVSYLEAADVGTTLTATAEETHLSRKTAEYEVVVAKAGDDVGESEDGTQNGDGDETAAPRDRVATFRGRVYRF